VLGHQVLTIPVQAGEGRVLGNREISLTNHNPLSPCPPNAEDINHYLVRTPISHRHLNFFANRHRHSEANHDGRWVRKREYHRGRILNQIGVKVVKHPANYRARPPNPFETVTGLLGETKSLRVQRDRSVRSHTSDICADCTNKFDVVFQ